MNATSSLRPALPPPNGTVSNFANPDFNGEKIIVVGIFLPVLTIPFLAARFYSKAYIVEKFHLDDYMILLAVPFALGNSILQMYQTKNGSGYHMWDITWEKYKKSVAFGWTMGPFFYYLATMFIKASILLFYLRFPSSRPFKVITYAVLFAVCFYSVFGAFTFVIMCRPVRSYWDLDIPGKCLNSKLAWVIGASFNCGTDYIILLLPIWLLKPLRLPLKQKIGVTLILMTGSFVTIVSTIRLSIVTPALVNPDFTWEAAIGLVWMLVETYFGIICACLPSLKTIIQHHFPGVLDFNIQMQPQLPTITGLRTDELQVSDSSRTQVELTEQSGRSQSGSCESGKARGTVLLHSIHSHNSSITEDPDQRESVQPPQKAFLRLEPASHSH